MIPLDSPRPEHPVAEGGGGPGEAVGHAARRPLGGGGAARVEAVERHHAAARGRAAGCPGALQPHPVREEGARLLHQEDRRERPPVPGWGT